MNILIIKLSAIGDVVQTIPALEAIKKTWPGSEIDWVVEEAAANILEGHPAIHRLLVSRRKAWLRMLRSPKTVLQGLRGIRGFLRALRSIQYDIAIDFQGLFKSGMVIGLARAQRKIGFDRTRELSYLFLNEKLPPYDKEKHALERYLDVARYLGAKDPSWKCTLPIEQEFEAIKARLARSGSAGNAGPLYVINPMARWRTKLWQEEKFSALADRLVKEKNGRVVFTGSAADRPVIEQIMAMMKERALNWAGETTLKELAALASLSRVFITTDTGPMHLAAAAGARVLALFGPTAPWRTGPYGPSHVVLRTGVSCSPCFERECGREQECMERISVEEVFEKIG